MKAKLSTLTKQPKVNLCAVTMKTIIRAITIRTWPFIQSAGGARLASDSRRWIPNKLMRGCRVGLAQWNINRRPRQTRGSQHLPALRCGEHRSRVWSTEKLDYLDLRFCQIVQLNVQTASGSQQCSPVIELRNFTSLKIQQKAFIIKILNHLDLHCSLFCSQTKPFQHFQFQTLFGFRYDMKF